MTYTLWKYRYLTRLVQSYQQEHPTKSQKTMETKETKIKINNGMLTFCFFNVISKF